MHEDRWCEGHPMKAWEPLFPSSDLAPGLLCLASESDPRNKPVIG